LVTAGEQPYAKIATATIMAGRDRRANTPAQARNFLDAMRGLFRWALKARLVKIDPTVGVDNPPRPKSDGFAPWTEDDIAAYEKRSTPACVAAMQYGSVASTSATELAP
jgi:hypothetical protein